MKILIFLISTMITFGASADIFEVKIAEQYDLSKKFVVEVSRSVDETICKLSATENLIENREFVALYSSSLSQDQGSGTYVVGEQAPSVDPGLNHWRYNCQASEKVDVEIVHRVKFVLSRPWKVIYLELPSGMDRDNVKVSAVAQPVHFPTMKKP